MTDWGGESHEERADSLESQVSSLKAQVQRMREALPIIRAVATILEDCEEEVIEAGDKTISIDRGNFIVLMESFETLDENLGNPQWGVNGKEGPFSVQPQGDYCPGALKGHSCDQWGNCIDCRKKRRPTGQRETFNG